MRIKNSFHVIFVFLIILSSNFIFSAETKPVQYTKEDFAQLLEEVNDGIPIPYPGGGTLTKADKLEYDKDGELVCEGCIIDGVYKAKWVGYKKEGNIWSAKSYTNEDGSIYTGASGCSFDNGATTCGTLEQKIGTDDELGGCSQIKIWEDIKFSTEYLEYYRNPTTDILAAGNVEYLVDTMLLSSAEFASFNNGEIVLNNISQSTFGFDTEDNLNYLNVISDAENNKLLIGAQTVILDSGEQVEAVIHIDGTVEIITNDEINIVVDEQDAKGSVTEGFVINTILNEVDDTFNLTNITNATIEQIGKSIIIIDDDLGLTEAHLGPTTRLNGFTNTTNLTTFSVYTKVNNSYSIYFRKHENQVIDIDFDTCTNCGLIDYVDQKVILKGIIEYERLNENMLDFSKAV